MCENTNTIQNIYDSENNEFIINNISIKNIHLFGVTLEEALAYVLEETGFINSRTKINGKSAKELSKTFYIKRNKFRYNTRLGYILVQDGVITKEELFQALEAHIDSGLPIGEILISMNLCTPVQIRKALDKQLELRSFDKF